MREDQHKKRAMDGKNSKEKRKEQQTNDERDIALFSAAFNGDARKVEELLSQGGRVDFRDQGFTPLLIAAQKGHTEVCKMLLETGKANVKETSSHHYCYLTKPTLRCMRFRWLDSIAVSVLSLS